MDPSNSSGVTDILAKDGSVITSVGTSSSHPVPIDLLQSLYLGRRQSIQSEVSYSQSGRSTPASNPSLASDGPVASSSRHLGRNTPPPAFWPSSVSYTTTVTFPSVRKLPAKEKKRILVTGGAGYVGSHLVDRLMLMGHDVSFGSIHYFQFSRTDDILFVGCGTR